MIYDNIDTNEYTELYPNPYVRQEMNRRIGNPRYVAMFYSIFDKHLRTIVDGINDPTKEVLDAFTDTVEAVFGEWRAWGNPDENSLGLTWHEFTALRDHVFEVCAFDESGRVRMVGTCTGRTFEDYQDMVYGEVWTIPAKLNGEPDPCDLRRRIAGQGVAVTMDEDEEV